MIKADGFKGLFSDDEKKTLETKEAEIDKALTDGKGAATIRLEASLDKRLVNELARRYQEAGWKTSVRDMFKPEHWDLTVSHPRLDSVFDRN